MSSLLEFDQSYNKIIMGVDEAGRGPLAGPVVAAAVIIRDPEAIKEANDSKKLSEKKREALFKKIMENCEVGIGIVDSKKIDEVNILNATFAAMREAINKINGKYELILVDGNQKIRELDKTQECIVEGDGKSLSIAAASIIAKVTRDKMMIEYAKEYPQYGFEKHKGYGTKHHTDMIKEHGATEIHRTTFLKNILKKI